jgi:hypothetical protein
MRLGPSQIAKCSAGVINTLGIDSGRTPRAGGPNQKLSGPSYAHLAAGAASKSVKLQRPARATVCSHSVKNATASIEPILIQYPLRKVVKIARLMDATDAVFVPRYDRIDSNTNRYLAAWTCRRSRGLVAATTTVISVLRPQKPELAGLRLFWMRYPAAFAC